MSILYTLRPSQLKGLAESVGDEQTRKTFLVDLARKLLSARLDGGADDDEVFIMARKLSAAGVWEKVPAHEVSFALAAVDGAVKAIFFEGLEPGYRLAVEEVIDALRQS